MIKSKADVTGAVVLAVLVLAGATLALAGFEAGLFVLLLTAGTASGMVLAHLATRPRRTRKPAALLFLLGLFALPIAALTLGIGWLSFTPGIPELPSGPFFFGFLIGAGQVAFGRLLGFDARADG